MQFPIFNFTLTRRLIGYFIFAGKVKENVNIPRGIVTSVAAGSDEFIGIYTHPDLGTPNAGGRLPLMGRYGAIVGMKTTATGTNISTRAELAQGDFTDIIESCIIQ